MAGDDDNAGTLIELINDKIWTDETFFSFEFWAPRSKEKANELKQKLSRMQLLNPLFINLTWRASTGAISLDMCNHIIKKLHHPCIMHLTCANMTIAAIDDALQTAKQYEIKNILTVSGDKDVNESASAKIKNDDDTIDYSSDLIKYINTNYQNDFDSIVIAGYAEGHPSKRKIILDKGWNPTKNKPKYHAIQAVDDHYIGVSDKEWKEEFKILREKIKNGAKLIITQFFYDKQIFVNFVKEAKEFGINVPILPGIMPISSYKSFNRWTNLCKTMIPKDLKESVEKYAKNSDKLKEFGLIYVARMCADLINENVVPGIHIYTMNNQKITCSLLKKLSSLCVEKFIDAEYVNKEYVRLHERKFILCDKKKECTQRADEIKSKGSSRMKIVIFTTAVSIVARRLYRGFA